MYYSSPVPISASSSVGELLCPGCDMCCDVIYCGELKLPNDYDHLVAKNNNKKKKRRVRKERRDSITSIKIIEAIRDVQQRAIYLQRKLKAMEKLKSETIKTDSKNEKRSRKKAKIQHRSCYCLTNPIIDEDRYATRSEPIKSAVKNDKPVKNVEEMNTKEAEDTTKYRKKVHRDIETQTETTSSSEKVHQKKSSKRYEESEVEEADAKDPKRGSLFGGCAPCGLNCGFRYEREEDDLAPSNATSQRENENSHAGCPALGSYRSRRRLTGVRSFPGGRSNTRRNWCCC